MNSTNSDQNINFIQINSIDIESDHGRRFIYTVSPPPEGLVSSIRERGILNPVVISGRSELISGVRRLRAAQKNGITRAPAVKAIDPEKAFLDGLWDNIGHRSFSTLELGEILLRLKETIGLKKETICSIYLPALGLSPSEKILEKYLAISSLPPEIKKTASAGGLRKSHLFLLTDFDLEDARSLSGIFSLLSPNSGEARIITESLRDLSLREKISMKELVNKEEIAAVINEDSIPPKHRIQNLRSILRKLALPDLWNREKEITGLASQAGFSDKVQLNVPRDLSGDVIEFRFSVKKLCDFTNGLKIISSEKAKKTVSMILDLLRGDRNHQ